MFARKLRRRIQVLECEVSDLRAKNEALSALNKEILKSAPKRDAKGRFVKS